MVINRCKWINLKKKVSQSENFNFKVFSNTIYATHEILYGQNHPHLKTPWSSDECSQNILIHVYTHSHRHSHTHICGYMWVFVSKADAWRVIGWMRRNVLNLCSCGPITSQMIITFCRWEDVTLMTHLTLEYITCFLNTKRTDMFI